MAPNPQRKKIFRFLDSSFFNGFLSACLVGLGTFAYSAYRDHLNKIEYIDKLNQEIAARFGHADYYVTHLEVYIETHPSQNIISPQTILVNLRVCLDNTIRNQTYSIIPEFSNMDMPKLLNSLKDKLPKGLEKDSVIKVFDRISALGDTLDFISTTKPDTAQRIDNLVIVKNAKNFTCKTIRLRKWNKKV